MKKIKCLQKATFLLLAVFISLPGVALATETAEKEISREVLQNEMVEAASITVNLDLPVKSAILTDVGTGTVLYAFNEDLKLPPASITKIMTLLLVMEAIDSGKITLDDKVVCSENAAAYGGSQIWLEPGEEMTVNDLIKATAISSANDATVCLAEYVAGSEQAFIEMMNRKAQELGMENTVFTPKAVPLI